MDRNCVLVSLFQGSERAAISWTKPAAGQQTHQYVHADCVSNCMANGVLLHTATCQELVEFLHGETLQPAQFLVVRHSLKCFDVEPASLGPRRSDAWADTCLAVRELAAGKHADKSGYFGRIDSLRSQ